MRFTAVITKEEKWYVARFIELGETDEDRANLKEAGFRRAVMWAYKEELTRLLCPYMRNSLKEHFWQKQLT